MDRREPDLVEDLAKLRKGHGLTPERLLRAGAVVEVLGGREVPIETLYERFIAALRSIHDTNQGKALWAAYGIDADAETNLTERRRAYGKVVGREEDRLRQWEDEAITTLALRLLTRFYAGSPTPAEFPVPHGGYLLRDLTVVCFMQDRRFVESKQTRTIISLVKGAQTFDYGVWNAYVDLTDVEGGTATLLRWGDKGCIYRITFPRKLEIGEPYTFSFHERIPEASPYPELDQDYSGQTFESPTLRYRVAVCFLGERPEVVWAYDKMHPIVRPGEPEDGLILPVGDDGMVGAEFRYLYGGLASGVAWRFPKQSGS